MSKTGKDHFAEKLSLIYEFNNNSPLFVRQANREIKLNNVEKALEILQSGLDIYPNYLPAQIIQAKAFALKGEYSKALKIYRSVSERINSPETFTVYLRELENIKHQRSAFELNKRLSTWVEVPEESDTRATNEENAAIAPRALSVDDRLLEIAQKIATIKLSDNPRANNSTDNSKVDISIPQSTITSETMAKIYVAQGEYEEAIKIYQQLIRTKPAKQSYFEDKISELKKRIEL